jgi:hypothetical protein
VKSISNIEHFLALPQDIFRLAIVNRGWRQQAYPRVMMLSVVPPKKTLRESTPCSSSKRYLVRIEQ